MNRYALLILLMAFSMALSSCVKNAEHGNHTDKSFQTISTDNANIGHKAIVNHNSKRYKRFFSKNESKSISRNKKNTRIIDKANYQLSFPPGDTGASSSDDTGSYGPGFHGDRNDK